MKNLFERTDTINDFSSEFIHMFVPWEVSVKPVNLWSKLQENVLLLVNWQFSNIITYVLYVRIRICLGEDLFGNTVAYLGFFFFPPRVYERYLNSVMVPWNIERRLLNCRNKFSQNHGTACFACGYVYWKRALSILFCIDYFISSLISWIITSHHSFLPWNLFNGLHTPTFILPKRT